MKILVSLLITLFSVSFCFGEDNRSKPAEVYVLFDNSASMQDNIEEAAEWLNGHVADNILQTNDMLTIWSVSDTPVKEFSGTITGPEQIEEIKGILSSITPKNGTGNFRAAFAELQEQAASGAGKISYIVLVTGISNQASFFSGAEAAVFLRYSRSRDFPGWKVMIISLGIEQKVKAAAAAYMRSQG